MLLVSAVMAITASSYVTDDSAHQLVRKRPVIVVNVYFPLHIVVQDLSDSGDDYGQTGCFYYELFCVTVIVQNCMKMFVCGGLRPSRGRGELVFIILLFIYL
jgi:hypothetical protein